jgi:hypothetical protein
MIYYDLCSDSDSDLEGEEDPLVVVVVAGDPGVAAEGDDARLAAMAELDVRDEHLAAEAVLDHHGTDVGERRRDGDLVYESSIAVHAGVPGDVLLRLHFLAVFCEQHCFVSTEE